jgi:hypothetical protein
MLDQFMVNKNMATGNAPEVRPPAIHILKPPAMINPDVYPKPINSVEWAKPVSLNGRLDQLGIAARRACVIISLSHHFR